MLSFTFIKEQDFMAWAHHDTPGGSGLFKSVATIIENVTQGYVNGVYVAVQRTVEGQTVQYIERIAERQFPNGVVDAWTVDSAMQYIGSAQTAFQGMEHLGGLTVTGLADGVIIPPFTMPASGSFTLSPGASKVTIGLAFTCDLQTLRLDLGEPTVQSKEKKINGVNVRVAETLGLTIGSDSSNLVPMKDLVRGNVGRQSNTVVTDLVTDDTFTYIDPRWTVAGQYFIRQANPYPATVLGVMPQVAVGDTK